MSLRPALALAGVVLWSLSCALPGASSPPAGEADEGHPGGAATEGQARAALDTYLAAAEGLVPLSRGGEAAAACLERYFCGGGEIGGGEAGDGGSSARDGHGDRPAGDDAHHACDDALRRFDDAALAAFGHPGSRWGGDLFAWVRAGEPNQSSTPEARLARMHAIDEYALDLLDRFWQTHRGDPVAIAVIRHYAGRRMGGCCRDETLFFHWLDRMEPEFGATGPSAGPWRRLTVGCNGGREDSRSEAPGGTD